MVHLWCLQKVKYHHTAVMKMRLRIALLYFVIQLHTSYPQELIYFSYISNHVHHLTARLCFFVKWCTSDASKRYNIVILFFGDFCILTSWRPNSAPWWNGAPLMPPFKPQTYSPAAELPQIAQSKLFKFQFGGNVKFENKINTKRTLFSCVSIVWIHFGKLPRNYCCREFAIYYLKLFQIASTVL